MHVVAVSDGQLARMRGALEHITPSASSNQLARTLEQVVACMDELHAEGGALAEFRAQWLPTRRAIQDLPEIHERAQHSAIRAQLESAEIAELESQLQIREGARDEVASIHVNTMNTVRRESPLLLTIAVLAAVAAVTFNLTWMLARRSLAACCSRWGVSLFAHGFCWPACTTVSVHPPSNLRPSKHWRSSAQPTRHCWGKASKTFARRCRKASQRQRML